MPRYVIERNIPGAGRMAPDELRAATRRSNAALRELGPAIRWEHSMVSGDWISCLYTAPDENMIRAHAELSAFPANIITPLHALIDPSTANEAAD